MTCGVVETCLISIFKFWTLVHRHYLWNLIYCVNGVVKNVVVISNCIMIQVFFAPDVHNRKWKVVLKAEPWSRRIGDDAIEADIGASGLFVGVRADDIPQPLTMQRATGVCVPPTEVEIVDARLEREDASEHYLDVDFVDNDAIVDEAQWEEILAE